MRVYDPGTGLLMLCFGLAAYQDGSIWASGCCTGIGAIMVVSWAATVAAYRRKIARNQKAT